MAKKLTLEWGGAEREFRLAIGQLRELQSKCDAGPATILARLIADQPQSAFLRRPKAEDFELLDEDPDFLRAQNLFAFVRQVGGDWRVDDVREIIRLGLMGGGASKIDADLAVARYVDEADEWRMNTAVAARILMHALLGEDGDPVGKPGAETTPMKEMAA